MTKKIFFSLIILLLSFVTYSLSNAQPGKVHKIIFQLSTGDTLYHTMLMKQLNNVLTAAPDAKLEVVCHGPYINLLLNDKTTVRDKIQVLKSKGVNFEACENTLKDKNISRDKIISEAGFVPSALIEIVLKQEEGWSYIKAGI